MASIGPNAKIRIEGLSGHSIGTFTFNLVQEKTPKNVIGQNFAKGYTRQPFNGTWSCEDMPNEDGSQTIKWDELVKSPLDFIATVVLGTVTHRFSGLVVDNAETTITADDGTTKVGPAGKYLRHEKF